MNILVSGTIAYDRIMNFPCFFKDHILPDKIHVLSVSFPIKQMTEKRGGTAGNIAYNLSLLKERPIILSSVGSNFDNYKKDLKKLNFDWSQIKTDKTVMCSQATIITDKADNQITGFYGGPMETTYKYNINKFSAINTWGCISPGNKKEMLNLAIVYNKKKIPFVFDPGQQLTVFKGPELKQAIKQCNVYICNDYEWELTKKKTGYTINKVLAQNTVLIITLGSKGSVIHTPEKQYKIPIAKPKKILDPTGAGDAYRAGLLKGLVNTLSWEVTGRLAATVSAYAVEKYGTQEHVFTLPAFKRTYYQNFNIKTYKLTNF